MDGEPMPSKSVNGASPVPGASDLDIYCPHCDYNLRGLPELRCPECGHDFDVKRVRSRPEISVYLFERKQWTDFRSLIRTAVAGFRPREYWTAVDRIGPPRIRMILWYWFAGAFLYMVTVCHWILAAAFYYAAHRGPGSSTFFSELFSGLSLVLLYYFGILQLSWPWSTFAVLWFFRGSMRRDRIGAGRLLRCALYCFDTPLWMGILLLPFSTVEVIVTMFGYTLGLDVFFVITCLLGLTGAIVGCWRLRMALETHLWTDQPSVVLVMSQIAVAVLICIVFLAPVLGYLLYDYFRS
jgi:hypothetical protein